MGQYDSWMANRLSGAAKLLPLNQLCLPGTHDSASYTLNILPTLPDNVTLQRLCRWVPFVYPVVKKWTRTQDMTIFQQLQAGIRYLDIRVSYLDGMYWCSHTIATVPLQSVLQDIYAFVSGAKQKGEVILCNMSLDFANRASMQQGPQLAGLWDLVHNHNIKMYLYQWAGDSTQYPSYSVVTTAGTPVLLLADPELHPPQMSLSSTASIISTPVGVTVYWNNSQTMLDNANKDLQRLLHSDSKVSKLNNNVLYVWEETLTPNKSNIMPPEITFAVGVGATSVTLVLVLVCAWAYHKYGNTAITRRLFGVFSLIVGIVWTVYITRLMSECPNTAGSIKDLTKQVRGHTTSIFASNQTFTQYMSVIRTDFPDTAFVESVIRLNTT